MARGAIGAVRAKLPVHGVSGMAGVGKTTALIGLGHDDDIKTHFKDGVLFTKAGAFATVDRLRFVQGFSRHVLAVAHQGNLRRNSRSHRQC